MDAILRQFIDRVRAAAALPDTGVSRPMVGAWGTLGLLTEVNPGRMAWQR